MADRTEEILGRYLDGDFIVFPLAETAVSRKQIAAIAAKLGVIFPEEIADHVCGAFPGIYVEVKEAVWPRPKEFDVGPFWSFLYAVHTYTSAPESEPWMRLDHEGERFQRATGLVAAPVLRVVGDADLYCVDASGALCRFRHEERRLEPVEGDYWSIFEREVRELRERKDRKRAEAARS